MLFNSYVFILAFLPCVVIAWFALNRFASSRFALAFLVVASLVFYGWDNPTYLPLLIGSVLANFALSKLMSKASPLKSDKLRKLVLVFGVLANIAVIGWYKYSGFIAENVNAAFSLSMPVPSFVLPLGISFFTFQQVSYLVDSWRGETEGYTFLEYAAFVTFFPQLVAGPIVLHDELVPQYRDKTRRKIDWDCMSDGLMLFCLGLLKKTALADPLGGVVAWGFANAGVAGAGDWLLVALSYTFQIYFDFSGYSDMAVGIGRMLNLELPQNFDSPYKATSVRAFWKGWHMSLTRFLTRYVYFPLGGSKRGQWRTYLNVMIVFLVSGIWHGANWTFILWGLFHGALSCFDRLLEKKGWDTHPALRWLLTFAALNVLWLLFRADSISQWIQIMKTIIGMQQLTPSDGILSSLSAAWLSAALHLPPLAWLAARVRGLPLVLMLILSLVVCLGLENNTHMIRKKTALTAIAAALAFAYIILGLSGEAVFLYFNF